MTEDISQQDLKEFYSKGLLAFEKKNYEYAIEIFSQILVSRYDHIEARHYLHLSLRHSRGNTPPNFIGGIINSINGFLVTFSAKSMLKKNDVSGALERFEKILANNPNDTTVLKNIAEVFYKKGLISQAIQNLEEAKPIASKDISIFKKLGEAYLKKEDYKNAKSNYELALKINPTDAEARKSLKNLDALGTIRQDFGS